ncbi:hypothetical protein C7974DRAFT_5317 [Boeremia exigua]|uniref:uncharacterized protein n=1 Tax=Boeremia exigua TaxID=749465 RepID=UPI001E8E4962|nr:uncharacterized protein C7974DRAFT_5317 [Boeremia exigua]KAH6643779.1 hypothetical protein C7974DRAFT_5317 [Boeremia exigua]
MASSTHTIDIPLLEGGKAHKAIDAWPSTPNSIRKSWYNVAWGAFFDVSLLAGALAFLAFASLVSRYDQVSTQAYPHATERLQSAAKYGPTVFPILFATILGRATHAILLWRLEKGERMGILDTLASSTSLTATVVSQFQLRSLSVFGTALITVWALSPVGGQASLRQLSLGVHNQTLPASFQYMVHNGYGTAWQHSDRAQPVGYLNTLFNGAIIAPAATQASPRDSWGNVKIPRIEYFEKRNAHGFHPDDEGWYDTNEALIGDSGVYTSLIGIPFTNISESGLTVMDPVGTMNYTTSIHTPYLDVSCSLNSSISFAWLQTHPPYSTTWQNFSGTGAGIWTNSRSRMSKNLTEIGTFKFSYITATYKDDDYRLDCNITNSYVETAVVCPSMRECRAGKVRRSQLNHFPEQWTMLDTFWFNAYMIFDDLLKSSSGDHMAPTMVDRYLSSPDLAVTDASMYNVSSTTETNYSIRLGQLLNAYFTGMNGLYAITGGLTNSTAYFWDNEQSFKPNFTSSSNYTDYPYHYNYTGSNKKARVWTTQGTKTFSSEILVANKAWVATLAVASVVLILASLVSPIAHVFLIRGPEVMMNISSLTTRDNPHISLPDSGTFLDASDRAKLLKEMRVKFGDVAGMADTGYLVIGAPSGAHGRSIAEIQKGRLYE